MNIMSRKFDAPEEHHAGWFRVFRFSHGLEVWFGKRWVHIGW